MILLTDMPTALAGVFLPCYRDRMSHILFGISLISAALQTAWALIAEEQLLALPVVAVMFYVGWYSLLGGPGRTRRRSKRISYSSGA